MCGICGVLNFSSDRPVSLELIKDMVAIQRHRGPDEYSVFIGNNIGLGHARLSIIDLSTGSQPICNEDKSIWVVFNGEIFNYIELREELKKQGHSFGTQSDTEVLVHLYEEHDTEFLNLLNGQFAFAIWDANKRQLMLARDRVGIRPLFYHIGSKQLTFASELKSILVNPEIPREIDPIGLKQIFSLWTTIGERTPLKGILEVPPGHYFIVKDGKITKKQYWDVDFSLDSQKPLTEEEAAEQLRALLIDSTRLRLRSDVPVGAYLSGGLDSSVTTSIIKNFTDTPLKTFSVGFSDERYDESSYQKDMARYLDTQHNEINCTYKDVRDAFEDVIWHAERPILRTAPTPLFLLSGLVKQHSFKVVLTGEGSDEMLGGYGIFKEDKLRRFWAKAPESSLRPLLLKRLYPYLPIATEDRAFVFLKKFFQKGLLDTELPYYSHALRFDNASWLSRFFSDGIRESIACYDPVQELVDSLPSDYYRWSGLAKAQYLEMQTLLSRYLLSSQGDRMAMAHSVEGRFPFLDHRVIEFCAKLPPEYKLKVFNEKYILKKAMQGLVPKNILERPKQAYRAPDVKSFLQNGASGYVQELLSEHKLKEYGLFAPGHVQALVKKCKKRVNDSLGEKDNMAFVSTLSTQIFYRDFVANFPSKVNRDKLEFRVIKSDNGA